MTLDDLLEWLDGRGLVVTDPDLLDAALAALDVDLSRRSIIAPDPDWEAAFDRMAEEAADPFDVVIVP